MRLFFGLEPDEHTALAVAAWRDRELPSIGRAVPVANLHITLAFLGEISPHRLERLTSATDELTQAKPMAAFSLVLDQLGYWAKPRICWLGPGVWPDELNRLASSLAGLGSAQGGKRSRGQFQPHITLLRNCDIPPPAPLRPPEFQLHFSHFNLLESRQGKSGVSYHPLASWQLH